jgi:formylglycine-generating enzyme required for sulfatase activity
MLSPQATAAPQNNTGAKAQSFTQEIPNTVVKFDMVAIPGGTLLEASANGQPRKVEIKPFWIGKTEVTWDEFDIYAFRLDLSQEDQAKGVDAASRPSKPYGAPDRGFGHAGYPALAMTVHSAQEYCNWLSKKTGKKFRLPTETEWEWAARANTLDAKHLAPAELEKVAWYWDTTEDKTQAVASKAPNAWGLYDTLGNVWEWCIGNDGQPCVRGGGYLSKVAEVHPGARQVQPPAWNENDPQNPKSRWWLSNAPFVGFRVVCEG